MTADVAIDNCRDAEGTLLREARQLFAQDATIGAILSIDLHQLNCDAALLAIVLGSTVADRKARQATEAEAVKVFQSDRIAYRSAIADITTTAHGPPLGVKGRHLSRNIGAALWLDFLVSIIP